jgi:hypothetical protein
MMSRSESSYVDSWKSPDEVKHLAAVPRDACAHDGELPAEAGYCQWSYCWWCACDCAHSYGDGAPDLDPNPSELQ